MNRNLAYFLVMILFAAGTAISKDGQDVFTIKGLYYGMDIQEVPTRFTDRDKLPAEWALSDIRKITLVVREPEQGDNIMSFGKDHHCVGFVVANDEGSVTEIHFGKKLVNKLFMADKMESSVFAKKIAKEHKIKLKHLRISTSADYFREVGNFLPTQAESLPFEAWYCTFPDGVTLTISDDKVIRINKKREKKFVPYQRSRYQSKPHERSGSLPQPGSDQWIRF